LDRRPLVSDSTENIEHAVVIPALAEGNTIETTLEALAANDEGQLAKTLIVVVVNNRKEPHASPEHIADNAETLGYLDTVRGVNTPLRLAYIDASTPGNELAQKEGVGTARKIGMDWAVHTLLQNGSLSGGIHCLDGDTSVERNYLKTLADHYRSNDARAAVVPFAHPFTGAPQGDAAIVCYEIFLRYHILGLRFAASPYAFHTVGSAMSCPVEAYCAVSGMNKRRAGEDFYFLEKLAKTRGVASLTGTTVHPSPRPSWRVPFGTGQRVRRYLDGGQEEYLLYDPNAYRILRDWLRLLDVGSEKSGSEVTRKAEEIEPELCRFLGREGFEKAWDRIRGQAPNELGQREQIHRWFDAFRSLKLIHHLRDNGFPLTDMFEALFDLMECVGEDTARWRGANLREDLEKQKEILWRLRELDSTSSVF
jgi:hypothetical protein